MAALHLGVRARLGTASEGVAGLYELVERLVEESADGLYLVSDAQQDALDPLVILGGLAPVSASLTLGELPSPLHRRSPGVFAKVIATLDVVSHGRAVATLGRAPSRAQGPWTLEVALEALRAMLRVPVVSLHTSTVVLDGARNTPLAASAPVPVALYLDRGAWSLPGAGEAVLALDLIDLAARFCERLYVEVDEDIDLGVVREAVPPAIARAGRLPGDLSVIPIVRVSVAATLRPEGVIEALAADGIVLDIERIGDEEELREGLSELRALRDATGDATS